MSRRTRVVPAQRSGFALLVAIALTVENEGLAQIIVSRLLEGVITARNGGAPLLAACKRLVKAGILEYDRAAGAYQIAAAYERTLWLLRSIPEGRIVTRARHRERPQTI